MDVGNLVHDRPDLGRFKVHRSTMVSPAICELERERIFDRCWLYLGHESEVPNPGDYPGACGGFSAQLETGRRVTAGRAVTAG